MIFQSVVSKILVLAAKINVAFSSKVLDVTLSRTMTIKHKDVKLIFSVPNNKSKKRAVTFSTKEPETLKWIDSFHRDEIFWDIGANVGIYSLYAGKKKNCAVYSFECSPFNIEWLARNIYLNNMQGFTHIIPLPLTDVTQFNSLSLSSTDWGGAGNSFSVDYKEDGAKLKTKFSFSTLGISMEDAVRLLGIPCPSYIKLDVDGTEHLILKGGVSILKCVKGVLVEINDDFEASHNDCTKYLKDSGLIMVSKHRWKETNCHNQIWQRS